MIGTPSAASDDYFLFESDPVRPMVVSPDGRHLYVANTPDGRLEVFAVRKRGLRHVASVPTGLEPVAVAMPDNDEVWVTNHMSDSVTIVDTRGRPHAVATLLVGDEPRDIVFAGTTSRKAFIATAHRGQRRSDPALSGVPGAGDPQLEQPGIGRADIWVFDAHDPGAAGGRPEAIVTLFGDSPRALATSPDGSRVYAAVFHSGNRTGTVSEGAVCDGGQAAPMCEVYGFSMPGGLPGPNEDAAGEPQPEVGLIARYNPDTGSWLDDLGRDWRDAMQFALPDFDVFEVGATTTPPVERNRFRGVGTTLFNMAVDPRSGDLFVSNTEALNDLRFAKRSENGNAGIETRIAEAHVTVIAQGAVLPRHLNEGLDYPDLSDPRGIGTRHTENRVATPMGLAMSANGRRLFLAAFGSSRVFVYRTKDLRNDRFDPRRSVVQSIEIPGGGPTGVVLDERFGRLFVSARFENSVDVVDLSTDTVVERHLLPTPEPERLRTGRRHLYDARATSANGEDSCASCHVFGDSDQLAWDLGNPEGISIANPNLSGVVETNPRERFHPLKGPMMTQTLRGLRGQAPYHWRGDRTAALSTGDPHDDAAGLLEFNEAFESLLGRPEPLGQEEMEELVDFLLSIRSRPNPIRNLDRSLTAAQFEAGNVFERNGCSNCHRLDPSGGAFGSDQSTRIPDNGPSCASSQAMNVPDLRAAYQKVGRFATFPPPAPGMSVEFGPQIRGFGFVHDGHRGDFGTDEAAPFILAIDSDLAPVVGQQVTVTASAGAWEFERASLLLQRASLPYSTPGHASDAECDLVAKGFVKGRNHGWLFDPGAGFRPDTQGESTTTPAELVELATTPNVAITFTCVPPGSGRRIGIDRDSNGILDGDEPRRSRSQRVRNGEGSGPTSPAKPSRPVRSWKRGDFRGVRIEQKGRSAVP